MLTLVAGLVLAAPLDSRAAERVIDLAFEAELAGDPGGARTALEDRIAAAIAPDEAAGRARLKAWLAGMAARLPAWTRDATRDDVVAAWSSLEGFGEGVEERAWAELTARRPELKVALPPVRIVVDRSAGLPMSSAQEQFRQALRRRGVPLSEDGLELALNLDATAVEREGRWVKVRAEIDGVLTSTGTDPNRRRLALFARTRTEKRVDADSARSFAVRVVALETARSVRFVLRRRALAALW